MITTKQKIVWLLTNTRDHALPKRDILMRVSRRRDFQEVYQQMIDLHIIEEWGQGKSGLSGSTKIVRKADEPDRVVLLYSVLKYYHSTIDIRIRIPYTGYRLGDNMKIQIVKHVDRKARWMTAERTLFITFLGLAILVTNYEVAR